MPQTEIEGASIVAERQRRKVESLNIPNDPSTAGKTVTVSNGVMTAKPTQQTTPEEFIAAADKALYRAKKAGRNRYQVWNEGKEEICPQVLFI